MRLIDADQAAEKLCRTAKALEQSGFESDCGCMLGAAAIVQNELFVPTVDPVKHGHWVFHPEMFEPPKCSECGVKPKMPGYLPTKETYKAWFKYCPNCGAKMDGGDADAVD